jgi:hypothetical protein
MASNFPIYLVVRKEKTYACGGKVRCLTKISTTGIKAY